MEPTQPREGGDGWQGADRPRPLLLRFLEVVDDRVAPTTLSKRTLTDLCHTLEDQVLVEDLEATIIAGFQRARYWAVERTRYEALTADPRRRAIVFTADSDERVSTVRQVVVGEEHELAREWFVLALTGGFSAVLFGRELVGAQPTAERDRHFLTIWSFDPTVVADLAEVLRTAAADLDPADVAELHAALQAVAPRVPEPLMVQRFINAVFERLESGQQRLTRASAARDAAERELARHRDRPLQLGRYATLSTAAAKVAHQLNNPLASITMAAATLSDVVDPEERTRLTGIIETEALRAGQIAGELQTLASAAPARLEPVELGRWLADEVDEHRRRGQEIEVTPREEPVTHVIDTVRLSQALSAVLSDALAAPGRSGAPRVGVEVGEGGPTIAVRRDGAAPDAAVLRMVADPFGAAAVTDGSMLDLTMASAHLRQQGGALTISVDGQVTAYHLEPPAGQLDRDGDSGVDDDGEVVGGRSLDDEAASDVAEHRNYGGAGAVPNAPQASGGGPVDAHQGAQRLALIVDDEPAIRGLVEALLRRAGWLVEAASTAEEARQATRSQHFDVVLLDVNLAGRDGRELLTELDGLRPGTAGRTAIITGDPSAARSLHGCPVVTKPFVWAELRAALDELTGPRSGAAQDPSVM